MSGVTCNNSKCLSGPLQQICGLNQSMDAINQNRQCPDCPLSRGDQSVTMPEGGEVQLADQVQKRMCAEHKALSTAWNLMQALQCCNCCGCAISSVSFQQERAMLPDRTGVLGS